MFGIGYLEISFILLLLIVLFGGRRIGRMLGKGYSTYRKVEDTKRKFSLLNFIGMDKNKNN